MYLENLFEFSLATLPDEMIMEILIKKYCDIKFNFPTNLSLACVCSRWRDLICSSLPYLFVRSLPTREQCNNPHFHLVLHGVRNLECKFHASPPDDSNVFQYTFVNNPLLKNIKLHKEEHNIRKFPLPFILKFCSALIHTPNLQILEISYNSIGRLGGVEIGKALAVNRTLTTVLNFIISTLYNIYT